MGRRSNYKGVCCACLFEVAQVPCSKSSMNVYLDIQDGITESNQKEMPSVVGSKPSEMPVVVSSMVHKCALGQHVYTAAYLSAVC
jgi:hypothetical protein